jgi:hypothetical protein
MTRLSITSNCSLRPSQVKASLELHPVTKLKYVVNAFRTSVMAKITNKKKITTVRKLGILPSSGEKEKTQTLAVGSPASEMEIFRLQTMRV